MWIAAILLGFFLFSSISTAQEDAPVYNLGTMQADSQLTIEPGKTGFARLYFFNIHGNRVTHVRLYVREAPEGWNVTIEPEVHIEQFNISGVIVNSTENLYIMPSSPFPDKNTSASEGFEYITMDGVEGYVLANRARIVIAVPENAALGKTYRINVEAVANWLGQTGTAVFSQSRSFDYQVTTVIQKYSEEPVKASSETGAGQQIPWIYYIVVILLIAVIVLSVLYLRKRKEH